jgi:peptidyl-prolyl cis-trans isomerase SurA
VAAVAMGLAIGIGGCSNGGLHMSKALSPWTKPAAPPAKASTGDAEAVAYTPRPLPAGPDTVDSVVASVDGNPITSHDVSTFNPNSASNGQPANAPAPETIPDDTSSKLKALITQQLIEQESQKFSDKVEESDLDHMIEGIEDRNHITDEQLRQQLQAQGISYAAFRANIRKQAEAMAMYQHEVRDKITIPDSEIQAYYKEHPEQFTVNEEKYRLSQILIAVPADATPQQVSALQAKANSVRKQAAKGADFAALARQYSDDDSKNKGGELGIFDANDLNDAIGEGIKALKPGEVSPVIRTKYGFHIIKVEAHQKPGEVPLSDVKAQIREKLQTDKSKDSYQKWIDQDLVKEHYVETTE